MAKGNGGTRGLGPRASEVRSYSGSVLYATDAEMEALINNAVSKKKTVEQFSGGGNVKIYEDFDYNENDYNDLLEVAKIKAKQERAQVEILPKIDADNPLYPKIFPGLTGTIYERKCPDLRVVSVRDGQRYIEYESFLRPFKPRDLSIMLKRGTRQASSVIIDIRDTEITPDNVRRQVRRNLADPDFKRPITRVWTYDGKKLQKVWG